MCVCVCICMDVMLEILHEVPHFLCRLNECSWGHIAIQILYVRASVRSSVKVLVNLFQIAPVRTGSLQL